MGIELRCVNHLSPPCGYGQVGDWLLLRASDCHAAQRESSLSRPTSPPEWKIADHIPETNIEVLIPARAQGKEHNNGGTSVVLTYL